MPLADQSRWRTDLELHANKFQEAMLNSMLDTFRREKGDSSSGRGGGRARKHSTFARQQTERMVLRSTTSMR